MKALFRILRWTLLGLGSLLLLLIFAIAILTQTDRFREWARDQLVTVINDTVQGSIAIGRLEGSIWRGVALRDVTIRYQGQVIAQLPRLTLGYSLLPLLGGTLQITHLQADQPSLRLERENEDEWNIVKALASREEPDSSESGLVLRVSSLSVRQGEIHLRLHQKESDSSYFLKDVDLDGSAVVDRPGVGIELNHVAAQLMAPTLPLLYLNGAVAFRDTASASTLNFSDFRLASGSSRLAVNGTISTRENSQMKANISVEKLAVTDLASFIPDWPIKRDLNGSAVVDGSLSDLRVNLDLAAGGARAQADLTLDVTQPSPRYQGRAQITGFDIHTLLEQENLAGIVSGTVQAQGSGLAIDDIEGQASVSMRAAALAGWALGDVSLESRLRNSVATLSGNLKSSSGSAAWRGQIAIKDKLAYDLAISVNDLEISKIVADENPLRGNLNFKGAIKGSGIDPEQLIARADMQILPSTIGALRVEQGAIIAAVQGQRVRITQASLRTQDTLLNLRGDVGLQAKQQGRLDYRLQSTDLGPWLALIDQKGSGAIELEGRATGNLADLQSRGTLKASAIRIGELRLGGGTIGFDLRRQENQSLPGGKLQLDLTGVEAGVFLQRLAGTVGLSSQELYQIAVTLTARDRTDRSHLFAARFDYGSELLLAHLNRLALELPDGTWQLAAPATITRHNGVFEIDEVTLQNRAQQLSINGRFAMAGKQDLAVTVKGFPLSGLSAFLRQPPNMSGIVALRGRIAGTATAPIIHAAAELTDASFAGQRYGGATANIIYKENTAALDLLVRQDEAHSLTASGTVPLNLSWSPEWRAEAPPGMKLRVQSKGLSIAFVNALSGDAAQDIAGNLSVDLLVQGAITKPVARGSFGLSDGAVRIRPLAVTISAVSVDGGVDGQTVSLRQLSARAQEGQLSGSGAVILKDHRPDNFKLTLSATRWPAIQTQRYQAVVDGKLQAEGTMAAPVLTGQLSVLNANLRPDLGFLSRSNTPQARDPSIVVIRQDENGAPVIRQPQQNGAQATPDVWKSLRLDVVLAMPNQVWIKHPDANIELGGKLRAVKEPGRNIALTGVIKTIRGWVGFQGRRFELARGVIQFTGGEKIEPALDIVAVHRLPGYQVAANVSGTMDQPRLELRSDPELEQSDILALLIFGKPIEGLTQGQQVSLQQSAIQMAGGFAATKVANAVTEALGLDKLGLDVGELDVGGGQIGFGRYIGNRTYVSISQEFSGAAGRQVSIEYRIGPDWKITSSTSTTGLSGIGILWQKRY
jgi:autotransporter translocation and assembly factor TamB